MQQHKGDMDNFDEIIKPLLEKKIRVTNHNIFTQRARVSRSDTTHQKPVITPLGKFPSITAAAKAHGVSKNAISLRLINKSKGYEYDDIL